MNIQEFKESNMQAMVKLDSTEGITPGMQLKIGESNIAYMVMMVLNDTDISVIKYDIGLLH